MAEQAFTRLANMALETSEQIVNIMEEGIAAVLSGGDVSSKTTANAPSSHTDDQGEAFDTTFDEDEEGMMGMESPLNGIADNVLKDIMKKQTQPKSTLEHMDAFRSAITWSEPFVCGLLLFQILMFAMVLYMARSRRSMGARIGFLVVIAIIVRSAEYMNSWGAANWESFATQNYFDKQGVFVGIMLSGPLLVNSMIMLIIYLREAAKLLVDVKTYELKKRKKQMKENETKNAASATAGSAKSDTGSRKKKAKQKKQE